MSRGHIRRRGDAWEIRVSAGTDPVTNRRRIVSRTVRGRRDDAERALTRLLAEVDVGAYQGPDTTLGVLLDRWWQHSSAGWAPNTRKVNRDYRTLYLDPHGDRPIAKITPDWLDQLYASLLQMPDRRYTRRPKDAPTLSSATVYKVHVLLHDALDDAVRWGWLASNPADRAQPPTVKRRPIEVPQRDRIREAVAAIAVLDPDFAMVLHLEAVLGPRRAELLGLRWSDLTEEGLHVRRTVVVDEQRQVLVQEDTKTHRARVVPLDGRTLELLEEHRLRWKDRGRELEVEIDDAYLFPRSEAEPFTPQAPDSLGQRWRRCRGKYGLDGVKLHAFRHAMCTYLLDSGVPVHDVAARAGHANANVTLAIYTHPTTEGARRAGDAAGL